LETELGKSPVITDGDLTIAESGAIIEYLVERYGDGCFAPARELPAYLRYRYWLHYAEGSLMSPLLLKLVFDKIEPRKSSWMHPSVPRSARSARRDNDAGFCPLGGTTRLGGSGGAQSGA
jgi:glutathione S-transferase